MNPGIMSKKVRLVTVGVIGMTALLGIGVVLSQSPELPDPRTTSKEELTEIIDDLPDVIGPTEVARQKQEHEENTQLVHERYRAWLEDFKQSGVDPRTLPRGEISALFTDGPATLAEAVSQSDIIVKGVVTGIEFFAPDDGPVLPYSQATFQVERLVKGSEITEGEEVEMFFGGGPDPIGDYPQDIGPETAKILYYAAVPLLLEGEEAVLLLHESRGMYQPLAWAGVNRVEDGYLKATDHGQIRELFDGKSVDEALDMLQDATESSP